MSNQDMNRPENLEQIMPADEQHEIVRAVVLDQHNAVWPGFEDAISRIQELPESVRHTHVVLLVEAIKVHFDWLRSHGIDAYFEVKETFGIEGLNIGDRL